MAFVLLLGVLALVLHIYVAQMMPVMTFDAEVDAHRATLSDVREFDFAVRKAVNTNEPQPAAVGANVEYPASLLKQPTPRYAVRTTEMENLTIENYDRICDARTDSADGPTPPPCEGEPIQQRYETTTLIFLAQYNEYQHPTLYGYEYGLVFSSPWNATEGDASVVTYNEQEVIDGDTLTLYTFTNPNTRADRTLIYTTIVPNGTKTTFTITDNGRPINLTLATEIGEDKWRRILSDESVSNGGYVQDVQYRNYTWYKDSNGEWKNCQEGHKKHKKNKNKCSNGKPGNANQDHWYDCDHPGKGKPFVQCTKDNSTNWVTISLAPGEDYTVNVYKSTLGGKDE